MSEYTCRRIIRFKKNGKAFRCDEPLFTDDEIGYGYCMYCLDALAESYNERREWDYYHSD